MNARVLLILLIITVLLALTKRWRRVGVSLSLVLMGLIVWQAVNSVSTTTDIAAVPASVATPPAATTPIDAVHFNRVELSGNGAPWRLAGELLNTSTASISAVKMLIARHSCASVDAELSSCQLLWQDEYTLRIKLAPAAIQRFEESIWSHTPVPRSVGVVRDSFAVIEVQTN